VRSHYDVRDDFFALWLDPARMHSRACYAEDTQTLAQGQQAQLDAAAGVRPLAARAQRAGTVIPPPGRKPSPHAAGPQRPQRWPRCWAVAQANGPCSLARRALPCRREAGQAHAWRTHEALPQCTAKVRRSAALLRARPASAPIGARCGLPPAGCVARATASRGTRPCAGSPAASWLARHAAPRSAAAGCCTGWRSRTSSSATSTPSPTTAQSGFAA